MNKGWEGGSTRKWRKIRAYVLTRDKGRCQLRINGICTYRADCVHHLKGKQFGDHPQYLVAACTPCNLHIGDPSAPRTAPPTAQPADPEPKPTTLWLTGRPPSMQVVAFTMVSTTITPPPSHRLPGQPATISRTPTIDHPTG